MHNEKVASAIRKVMLVYLVSLLFFGISGCEQRQTPCSTVQCKDALGCVTVAPGEPVKLGGLQTLSGGSLPGGLEQTIGRRDGFYAAESPRIWQPGDTPGQKYAGAAKFDPGGDQQPVGKYLQVQRET